MTFFWKVVDLDCVLGHLFVRKPPPSLFLLFFPLLVSTRWFAGILFVRIPSLSAHVFFSSMEKCQGWEPTFIHPHPVGSARLQCHRWNGGEHWWIQKKLSFNRDTPYWFSLFGFAFWVGRKSKRVWIDMNGYMDLYGRMFICVYWPNGSPTVRTQMDAMMQWFADVYRCLQNVRMHSATPNHTPKCKQL